MPPRGRMQQPRPRRRSAASLVGDEEQWRERGSVGRHAGQDLRQAKQRLAGVLSQAERHALFRAMLEDVLSALAASAGLGGILMVTGDPEARGLRPATARGCCAKPPIRATLRRARLGARRLAREGAAGMLQLPADIPLVAPADLAALLAAHGAPPAVTSPPRATTGARTRSPARRPIGCRCASATTVSCRTGNGPAPSASSRGSSSARGWRSTSTRPMTSERSSPCRPPPGPTAI